MGKIWKFIMLFVGGPLAALTIASNAIKAPANEEVVVSWLPSYITSDWIRVGSIALGFIYLCLIGWPYLSIYFPRNRLANSGADAIFQDDDELTFGEIAQRWSSSAHAAPGFSVDEVMTALLRSVWLKKLHGNMTWNYERVNAKPLVRVDEHMPTNRASLIWAITNFWEASSSFFVDAEKKCLSLVEAEKRGDDEKHMQKHIDTQFEKMGTWKRLASLAYDQFDEDKNILKGVYFSTICVKKDVFTRWLKKSKVRLPANW